MENTIQIKLQCVCIWITNGIGRMQWYCLQTHMIPEIQRAEMHIKYTPCVLWSFKLWRQEMETPYV